MAPYIPSTANWYQLIHILGSMTPTLYSLYYYLIWFVTDSWKYDPHIFPVLLLFAMTCHRLLEVWSPYIPCTTTWYDLSQIIGSMTPIYSLYYYYLLWLVTDYWKYDPHIFPVLLLFAIIYHRLLEVWPPYIPCTTTWYDLSQIIGSMTPYIPCTTTWYDLSQIIGSMTPHIFHVLLLFALICHRLLEVWSLYIPCTTTICYDLSQIIGSMTPIYSLYYYLIWFVTDSWKYDPQIFPILLLDINWHIM